MGNFIHLTPDPLPGKGASGQEVASSPGTGGEDPAPARGTQSWLPVTGGKISSSGSGALYWSRFTGEQN